MSQNVLAQQMRSAAIFKDLTTDQLVEVALHAERKLFREGENIAVQGDNSAHAILIVDGSFECEVGVGAGQKFEQSLCGVVIGEMAMFLDDFVHPATFVASSRVKALQINREQMLRQMAKDPDLAARLVDAVSSRLTTMASSLRDIEQRSSAILSTTDIPSNITDQLSQ